MFKNALYENKYMSTSASGRLLNQVQTIQDQLISDLKVLNQKGKEIGATISFYIEPEYCQKVLILKSDTFANTRIFWSQEHKKIWELATSFHVDQVWLEDVSLDVLVFCDVNQLKKCIVQISK